MTPARAVVKLAQAKAEKAGYEFAAEHFREDDKGFWEKRARAALFEGKSKEEAAEEMYRAATLQRGALDGVKKEFKFFRSDGSPVLEKSGRILVLFARSQKEALQAARDYGFSVDSAQEVGHGFDGVSRRVTLAELEMLFTIGCEWRRKTNSEGYSWEDLVSPQGPVVAQDETNGKKLPMLTAAGEAMVDRLMPTWRAGKRGWR